MKKVYLDNASTTPIYPEVITEMVRVLNENFGNPSSSHSFGQHTKNEIELARKSIAKNLNCNAQEIIFTSGATESNNLIIQSAVKSLGIERIITSKIEHHAVLHTIEMLSNDISIDYVKINSDGHIDYSSLEILLQQPAKTLVSLMHVNNEIGTILNLEIVSDLCKQHKAFFHTDAVQGVGKSPINLSNLSIDFLSASAHKFHGPKGVGFAYIKKNIVLNPLFFGGEQEKGMRAGTESVHNIIGMAKALDISLTHLEETKTYIQDLKNYLIQKIHTEIPETILISNDSITQYNIINIILPKEESKSGMIVFLMDMNGIAISRGSACQSGSSKPSHVLEAFIDKELLVKPNVRISFSKYNTKEDVDKLIETIQKI